MTLSPGGDLACICQKPKFDIFFKPSITDFQKRMELCGSLFSKWRYIGYFKLNFDDFHYLKPFLQHVTDRTFQIAPACIHFWIVNNSFERSSNLMNCLFLFCFLSCFNSQINLTQRNVGAIQSTSYVVLVFHQKVLKIA